MKLMVGSGRNPESCGMGLLFFGIGASIGGYLGGYVWA